MLNRICDEMLTFIVNKVSFFASKFRWKVGAFNKVFEVENRSLLCKVKGIYFALFSLYGIKNGTVS